MPFLDLAVKRWWTRWVYAGRKPWARRVEAVPGWALSYTLRYRLTVCLLFIVFTTLYYFAFFVEDVFPPEPGWKRWGITIGSILLWALISGVFVAMWVERVFVSEQMLIRRSWRGIQRVEWSSIESVGIAGESDAIIFHRRGHRDIRVSLFLDGLWSLEPLLVYRFGGDMANRLFAEFPARG